MLDVFGILDAMEDYVFRMMCDINPKTDDFYTYEEINKLLGFPDGVEPSDYLNKMEEDALYLTGEINPKTGKYYTSDEIAHTIGLLKDCSYV